MDKMMIQGSFDYSNTANQTNQPAQLTQSAQSRQSTQPNRGNCTDQHGQYSKEIRYTRRIGSITCGLILILYGILFMIHIIQPRLNYAIIFKLWPLILIVLGVEILAGCTGKDQEKKKYVYDFAAVILIFIVAFFAMIMSAVSYYYDHYDVFYGSEVCRTYSSYSSSHL